MEIKRTELKTDLFSLVGRAGAGRRHGDIMTQLWTISGQNKPSHRQSSLKRRRGPGNDLDEFEKRLKARSYHPYHQYHHYPHPPPSHEFHHHHHDHINEYEHSESHAKKHEHSQGHLENFLHVHNHKHRHKVEIQSSKVQ